MKKKTNINGLWRFYDVANGISGICVGANIEEANPLTLQLFKLAMSLFSRPLNINDVLSYLQLPVGPVPRKLRSALAYILATNGGFGEIDWNDISDENEPFSAS